MVIILFRIILRKKVDVALELNATGIIISYSYDNCTILQIKYGKPIIRLTI